MGLRMKNVNIVGIHWNIQFFRGELSKWGVLTVCRFKGGLAKKRGGWYLSAHYEYFACCCSNLTIFTGKIKIRWKWPCLAASIRDNFLLTCFDIFWKCQLLSVSLTFCFISKINYKNENWYHCRCHLLGFY